MLQIVQEISDAVSKISNMQIESRMPADRKVMLNDACGGELTKKKKSRWKNPAALLTNPLNSQLDTNVPLTTVGKKWISCCIPSLL